MVPSILTPKRAEKAARRASALKGALRLFEKLIGYRDMRKIRHTDPRFGRLVGHLVQEGSLGDLATDVSLLRTNVTPEAISKSAKEIVANVLKARSLSLTEEIASVVNARSDNEGVIMRLGLSGGPTHTLQQVGELIGVTRERVRQKQAKLEKWLQDVGVYSPVFDRLISEVNKRLGPTVRRASDLEHDLQTAALLSHKETLSQILAFARLKGLERFETFEFRGIEIASRSAFFERFDTFVNAVHDAVDEFTRDFGACSLEALRDRLEQEAFVDCLPALPLILECFGDDIEWLEGHAWLRLRRKWNRYSNLARKILAVAPQIRITELRKGIQRNHRVQYVPPSRVLGRIIESELDDVTCDGTFLEAQSAIGPLEALSASEAALYGILLAHGGAMARSELEDCAIADGMSRPSFYMLIQYSPIIDCLAKGVYGVRGLVFEPGVVERLAMKSAPRSQLERDYGNFADGRIWLTMELSKPAIEGGILHRPAGLRDYVGDGSYQVRLNSLLTAYEVKCSSDQFRFSRAMLSSLGVEPNDYVLMVFDKVGIVDVHFGDAGVSHKIRDSERLSAPLYPD